MIELLLLTTNRAGVLSRVTSIVSALGLNITSASAEPAADPACSHIRLRAEGTPVDLDRLRRRLLRLVDVIECTAGGD